MPTSNTQRAKSAASDSPVGAPANNAHETKRAKNWAQDDGASNGTPGNSAYQTENAGNTAQFNSGEEPKPAQGA